VSTRTDGTKSARPGSSASVGSTMGSGWKSAMAHQKPQALGSGAK